MCFFFIDFFIKLEIDRDDNKRLRKAFKINN